MDRWLGVAGRVVESAARLVTLLRVRARCGEGAQGLHGLLLCYSMREVQPSPLVPHGAHPRAPTVVSVTRSDLPQRAARGERLQVQRRRRRCGAETKVWGVGVNGNAKSLG